MEAGLSLLRAVDSVAGALAQRCSHIHRKSHLILDQQNPHDRIISCPTLSHAKGRFLTTNEGAPYLARLWRDVGINCSRPAPAFAIPPSGQSHARHGAPSTVPQAEEHSGWRRSSEAAPHHSKVHSGRKTSP